MKIQSNRIPKSENSVNQIAPRNPKIRSTNTEKSETLQKHGNSLYTEKNNPRNSPFTPKIPIRNSLHTEKNNPRNSLHTEKHTSTRVESWERTDDDKTLKANQTIKLLSHFTSCPRTQNQFTPRIYK